MMSFSRLEQLPIELFHELFGYFWADEIIHSFQDLNSYLNDVLKSYQSYAVSFQGRKQSVFEKIYRHIRPEQVISLTISDGVDTPGQPDWFLLRYKMVDFVRLKSFTLADITSMNWEALVQDLTKLTQLRSFAFIVSEKCRPWKGGVSDENELDLRLFKMYGPILPQLQRLKLSHGRFLTSIRFDSLQSLALNQLSFSVLQNLTKCLPKLQSLRVKEYSHISSEPWVFPFPNLKLLDMRCSGQTITMEMANLFMTNLPRLQHLKIDIVIDRDMLDGNALEEITSNLILFDFKFVFNFVFDEDMDVDLTSFRTPFWLEKKRWFVIYSAACLYTLQFSTTEISTDVDMPENTTLPSSQLFFDRIRNLTVETLPDNENFYLNHVNTLSLEYQSADIDLSSMLNLANVKHIILSTIDCIQLLLSVQDQMINLSEISIHTSLDYVLHFLFAQSLQQIRTLKIEPLPYRRPPISDDQIITLSSIFPRVENLFMNISCSIDQLLLFIKQFKYLSTIAFSADDEENHLTFPSADPSTFNTSLEHAIALGQIQCTYRVTGSDFHLWLADQCSSI